MSKAKIKTDLIQEITDQVIEALENGSAPWVRPWSASGNYDPSLPFNACTGRHYNGINVLLLWMVAGAAGYPTNGWLTYKQAEKLGGQVRKGEKGARIVFWNFFKKDVKDDNGKVIKTESIPYLKKYTVFNVAQIDGLSDNHTPEAIEFPQGGFMDIYEALNVKVGFGGDKAFYAIGSDRIQLPLHTDFKSRDHFESTAAHELSHWTGAKSRLGRDFGTRFGSNDYAFEELIAEMSSAFLCGTFGLPLEELQHTEYLVNWLEVLKNDKYALFTASKEAKKAAEYILDNAGVEWRTAEELDNDEVIETKAA